MLGIGRASHTKGIVETLGLPSGALLLYGARNVKLSGLQHLLSDIQKSLGTSKAQASNTSMRHHMFKALIKR